MKRATIIRFSMFIIFIITIIIAIYMIFGNDNFRQSKTHDISSEKIKFSQTITEKIKDENTNHINIDDCTYFSWDEGYIFSPYYNAEDAYKITNSEWTRTNTYYKYILTHRYENDTVQDNEVLIVFFNDNKPIVSGILKLDVNFNFPEERYIKITSNNSIFNLDRENNKLVYKPKE